MTTAVLPRDFLSVDTMLSDEERDIRDTVRAFVRNHVLPNVGEWFDEGRLPRELVGELGKLGVLGMHLEGYGCAGTSATAYGLACLELEAGDSGIRSLVSVQGSLAMFAIHRRGSEEQKQEWLPRMAAGEAVGCFGLTEPDSGSDPGSMRTYARRDGADWVLRGQKMWITNGSWADVAVVWARTEEGFRGFLVPRDTRGFTTPDIDKKLSLRASITSELILDEVRLPASAMLPGTTSLRGPLSCRMRRATASYGEPRVRRGRASRPRRSTAPPVSSSASRSRRFRSNSTSSRRWLLRSTGRRYWRCISAA